MTDQRSSSDDENPVDYGPEYWEHFLDDLSEEDFQRDGPHLFSVDALRAAGALDVPAAWRKSLHVERDLFTGLFDEDDLLPEKRPSASRDVETDDPNP